MLRKTILPPPIRSSKYGPPLRQRVADLPGLTFLRVRDLFSDIPKEIYLEGEDISVIRKATEDALARVDMGMIRTEDTVNILCSQYGFQILDGEPYAEMIRTIKDVVQQRTGCENIRLRVATGMRLQEPKEIIKHYKLDQYFNRRAVGITPIDKGVPIETEIGTLYGVARAYDADWIIHAHYNELRELDCHRLIDRAIKSFAMAYARLETRAVAHVNFGPRSANFIQRVIFNSPFVQRKFTFGCFLMVSPAGIVGIDAENDLNKFNRRLTEGLLKSYGKLLRLLAEIDECIAVADAGSEPRYMFGGGMTFGNFVEAKHDLFDLDNIPYSLGLGYYERPPGAPVVRGVNPALKALVINHMWLGVPFEEIPVNVPTIVVGRDLADMLIGDPTNPEFMSLAVTAESLEAAMDFAHKIAKTDNIIVFDGTHGGINLSPSLAEFLLKKAPEVGRKVDEELLPKWLRQRGIAPLQHVV